jgi:hypothetical protein
MLALRTGCLLKVRLSSSILQNSKNHFFFPQRGPVWHPRHVLLDWNYQKIPFFSEPPALHAAYHIPSEVLFGEVDAEAIDAEPDSELAADAMSMNVEDKAKGGRRPRTGGMIVNDDSAAQ